MDRTASIGKLGDKSAETDSRERTGHLERTVGTGQSGRTAMAGKIQQDGWERPEKDS
jgi:hypothetical protein